MGISFYPVPTPDPEVPVIILPGPRTGVMGSLICGPWIGRNPYDMQGFSIQGNAGGALGPMDLAGYISGGYLYGSIGGGVQ